jgi:hypothetical protein
MVLGYKQKMVAAGAACEECVRGQVIMVVGGEILWSERQQHTRAIVVMGWRGSLEGLPYMERIQRAPVQRLNSLMVEAHTTRQRDNTVYCL